MLCLVLRWILARLAIIGMICVILSLAVPRRTRLTPLLCVTVRISAIVSGDLAVMVIGALSLIMVLSCLISRTFG